MSSLLPVTLTGKPYAVFNVVKSVGHQLLQCSAVLSELSECEEETSSHTYTNYTKRLTKVQNASKMQDNAAMHFACFW